MNPEDLRHALSDETIPEHRPGFWDRLEANMDERPSTTRSGWWVALQAAAAVLVVAGVAAGLVRNFSGIDLDPGGDSSILTGSDHRP